MLIEGKIELLGEAFRGLWKSYELQSEDEWANYELQPDTVITNAKWCLTFIFKGKYVETPLFDDIHEPLDFAIGKLGISTEHRDYERRR